MAIIYTIFHDDEIGRRTTVLDCDCTVLVKTIAHDASNATQGNGQNVNRLSLKLGKHLGPWAVGHWDLALPSESEAQCNLYDIAANSRLAECGWSVHQGHSSPRILWTLPVRFFGVLPNTCMARPHMFKELRH